ncbi:MAG: hypothetical protein QNJ47_23020 [Nostocaceae cyanobacterium]|nr:hypothetical protein [Nostocaceae cyanobacterium]
MKKTKLFTIVPVVLGMSLLLVDGQKANAGVITINSQSPDTVTVNGQSGGSQSSNCGNIPPNANHILELTESMPYLRLTVESQGEGKPTLSIKGPGGDFCVMADSYSGGKAEMSGYFEKGQYQLKVGELSSKEHPYTLSISREKK